LQTSPASIVFCVSCRAVKLLLTNDDGVRADGLAVLASVLSDIAEVFVVAPDRERSATSHSFSLYEPLRVEKVGHRVWAVSGTPADCAYLGVLEFCKDADWVISGINHGYNLGADVFYSGTVAAAVEASLRGFPSIAMSMGTGPGLDFHRAAQFCTALLTSWGTRPFPKRTLLSVNVPGPKEAPPSAGKLSYQITRLGERSYRSHVESRTDPRGNTYYWIGGPLAPAEEPPGTDVHAIRQGSISVTPLGLDLTHNALLSDLPTWEVPGYPHIPLE